MLTTGMIIHRQLGKSLAWIMFQAIASKKIYSHVMSRHQLNELKWSISCHISSIKNIRLSLVRKSPSQMAKYFATMYFVYRSKELGSRICTRTRWRRVKTLAQHQVGVNLQSHAQHQLWISHMAYFSWIPQNNARLKPSCKFGESKCDSCWHITLTTSHDMNYVLNEHLDFSQHDPYAIPSVMILWCS